MPFLCYCSIALCSMGLGMLYLEFQHVILKQHGRVNVLHHQHQAICPCCSSLQNHPHGVWVFGTLVSARFTSCMMCLLLVHELYDRFIEWYLRLLIMKNHRTTGLVWITLSFLDWWIIYLHIHISTVHLESCCALRLRYVDFVVSNEIAIEVCCCFTVFSC
jgi:hypothetical protein